MSPFEFVFTLFGLLLGLSLVEVVNGLVRTVRARKTTRLGYLTPLLGLFVMFDLTSFWATAWDSRTMIPANFASMLVGMLFTAAYYFAASLVFPGRPETCEDLDTWYFRHKREVIGIVLVLEAILTIVTFSALWAYLYRINFAIQAVYFLLLITSFVARGSRLNAAALAGLILLYLFVALVPHTFPSFMTL